MIKLKQIFLYEVFTNETYPHRHKICGNNYVAAYFIVNIEYCEYAKFILSE